MTLVRQVQGNDYPGSINCQPSAPSLPTSSWFLPSVGSNTHGGLYPRSHIHCVSKHHTLLSLNILLIIKSTLSCLARKLQAPIRMVCTPEGNHHWPRQTPLSPVRAVMAGRGPELGKPEGEPQNISSTTHTVKN